MLMVQLQVFRQQQCVDKNDYPKKTEVIRVTKKGGIIFAANVISDGCLLDDGF